MRWYPEETILDLCLRYLYAPAKNDIEHFQRLPWNVLLLIKWTFLQKTSIVFRRKEATQRDINKLILKTYHLGDLVMMPNEYENVHLFMRKMAFQQFIYQERFSYAEYSRQSLMFGKLEENSRLGKRFQMKHGLSCSDFIVMSISLVGRFKNMEHSYVDRCYFYPIDRKLGTTAVNSFLNSISVELKRLPEELNRANQSKGGVDEYYEQTPFLRFPLIRHHSRYFCVHPSVLYRCVEHFIYDTLKETDPKWFMDNFSDIYENYLSMGMEYASCTFYRESELKKYAAQDGKCVDYLIEEESNIFLEAKAVEMHYSAKIASNPRQILDRVKSSALKAIEQVYSLNESLVDRMPTDDKGVPKFNKESFLLVVTYKELYIGNGAIFYESIASEKLDRLIEKTDPRAVIPLHNIFFITTDDFDRLMQLAKSASHTITEMLQKVVQNDSDPRKSQYSFGQHLNKFADNLDITPDYLQKECDRQVDLYRE